MTISLPITALVASAMLLHPATAFFPLTSSKIGDFDLFTKNIKQSSTSLKVGGRIAIGNFTDDSGDATLEVGQNINLNRECPNPLAYCPLEELVHFNETVFYSKEVPWNVYTSATVYNGVALSYYYNVGNTAYENIAGWQFWNTTNDLHLNTTSTCGPNKLYEVELVDFPGEISLAEKISNHLDPKTQLNCDDKLYCIDDEDQKHCAYVFEGEFCHENKLLVIPKIVTESNSNAVPVVRYNLTCAQFNDMNNYEIFDRRTGGEEEKLTLSFTFDDEEECNECQVTTNEHSIFDNPKYNIVWNFIGNALRFKNPGTFYGTFIAAAGGKEGIIGKMGDSDPWTGEDAVVKINNGQVIAKYFDNLPAVINVN